MWNSYCIYVHSHLSGDSLLCPVHFFSRFCDSWILFCVVHFWGDYYLSHDFKTFLMFLNFIFMKKIYIFRCLCFCMKKRTLVALLQAPAVLLLIASFVASLYVKLAKIYNIHWTTPALSLIVLVLYFWSWKIMLSKKK